MIFSLMTIIILLSFIGYTLKIGAQTVDRWSTTQMLTTFSIPDNGKGDFLINLEPISIIRIGKTRQEPYINHPINGIYRCTFMNASVNVEIMAIKRFTGYNAIQNIDVDNMVEIIMLPLLKKHNLVSQINVFNHIVTEIFIIGSKRFKKNTGLYNLIPPAFLPMPYKLCKYLSKYTKENKNRVAFINRMNEIHELAGWAPFSKFNPKEIKNEIPKFLLDRIEREKE